MCAMAVIIDDKLGQELRSKRRCGAKQKKLAGLVLQTVADFQLPPCKIYIDNELVVNNDGSHAAIPATGFIALEKGFHSYKLYYFEDYEGEHLSWAWKLPSAETLVPIPSSVLYVE